MRRCALTVISFASIAVAMAAAPATPTFNKDVLPILQKNCQSCHRDGAIAPMSLVTYEETRPYARAMARAVRNKTMPPWFADPAVGHFRNAKILSDADVATIGDWAEGGALEGDAKDKPAPVDFADGWTIGKPDIVVTMPKDIDVPATGAIEQSNVLVRAHFEQDVWVKAAEVKPGNPRVVHHMKAWVRPPDSPWMKDAPEGELYDPPRGSAGFDAAAPTVLSATGYRPVQDILAKYNPGVEGQAFATGSAAKFIAAGSDIVFEVHYTASGKPEKDRSSVGLVLADAPPQQRHLTTTAISASRFEIPAGDSNYAIKAETIVTENAKLVWVQPHMHYRGKDYELKVIYPSGEEVTVLRVPHYRFDWQVGYELAQPLDLPKGTTLRTVSHYDNSAANKFNPDPTKNIRFGAQSWDEMNVSFVGILIDVKANPARTFGGTRPLAPE
jgi:hypothetical protein